MRWQKKAPSKDGFYWVIDPQGSWATQIVQYTTMQDVIWSPGEAWIYHLDDFRGCLWAGPIPMPEGKTASIGKTRQQIEKNSPSRGEVMAYDWKPTIYKLMREKHDFFEAAEFEARVAAKLTELAHWIAQGIGADMECTDLCDASDICENAEEMPCKWCFLKWARLQVEEEMDG